MPVIFKKVEIKSCMFNLNNFLFLSYQTIWGCPSLECNTTFWRMTIYSDTLHWWDITPIFDTLLIWTLLPNLAVYLIVWGFHRTFATGAACQQRALTPLDTWSCPTLGLACVLISRPISPELVLFPDFWVSNIPRNFCFALNTVVFDNMTDATRTKDGQLNWQKTTSIQFVWLTTYGPNSPPFSATVVQSNGHTSKHL